jgi:hypothetical protein
VYSAGFLLFPPHVLLINDEERYVTQAVAFARGALTVPGANALAADSTASMRVVTDYPPGTSLLQAPLVAVAGWRGAALLSLLSLAALVLCTGAWLRQHDLTPAFALVVPAFLAALFFGRTAMSDMPAAALTALSLYLLALAERGGAAGAAAAGFTSGLLLLFREPALLILVPFAAALMIERPRCIAPLIAGGVVAVGARLALSHLLFGDAMHVRDPGYGFSLSVVPRNLLLYGAILLGMFPFGAVLPFTYSGRHARAVRVAFTVYVLLFLTYDYNAWRDNGYGKGTLLAARFMLPLLPLLALAAADVVPRLLHRLPATWRHGANRLLPVGLTGVAAAAFAIHPLVRRLGAEQAAIMNTIRTHTTPGTPLVVNEKAAGKYLSPVYGPRLQIDRQTMRPGDIARYCRRFGRVGVVLLDRTDTELFRQDALANATFLADAARDVPLRQRTDTVLSPVLRLRILEATDCGAT